MAVTALTRVIHRLRSDALRDDGAGLADSELLECYIVHRDETAFEALVRRHGPMVFGVCRRILRNDADAEDAFQATFLVLVRKASSIRPRGMVSNWLYGVAHNTALKAKAMIHKRRTKETAAGTMPKADVNGEVCTPLQTVVDAELALLPDKYRVPIVLCDLEGKTIKEAMRHLGWPQGTVASRLMRGRALLAKRLARHGMVLSAGLLAVTLAEGACASVPPTLAASTVQAATLFAAGKAAAATGVSATAVALTEGVLRTMLLVKLKLAVTALVVAALLTTGAGVFTYRLLGAEWPPVAQAGPQPTEPGTQEGKAELERAAHELRLAEAQLEAARAQLEVAKAAYELARQKTKQAVKAIKFEGRIYIHRSTNLGLFDPQQKKFVELKPLDPNHQFNYQASSAKLSPDGVHVAFGQADAGTPPSKIQVRSLSKDDPPRVLVNMPAKELSSWNWSPDGKQMAFAVWGDAGKNYEPYVVDVPTGKAHKVVLPALAGKGPEGYGTTIHAWSPDGLWLVFAKGHFNLVHPQTKDSRQLNTEPTGFLAGTCRFSPDGKSLLFIGAPKDKEYNLSVINLLVGKTTVLANFRGRWDFSACWSPDSRRILCSTVEVDDKFKRNGPSRVEVFSLEPGVRPAVLIEDPTAWFTVTDWREPLRLPPVRPPGMSGGSGSAPLPNVPGVQFVPAAPPPAALPPVPKPIDPGPAGATAPPPGRNTISTPPGTFSARCCKRTALM
jgi:RNA polymerase sigma factor (sigma-70 family)